MVRLTVPEWWAFQSLMDDLRSAGMQFLTIYGVPYPTDYSLEDRERLLIVGITKPCVELHVLFTTPHYLPYWIEYVQERYDAVGNAR